MSLSNERSYYSEEDIRTAPQGFLRIVEVLTYNNTSDTGTCMLDNIEYTFINPHFANPAVGEMIVIANVDKSNIKVMMVSWEGVE